MGLAKAIASMAKKLITTKTVVEHLGGIGRLCDVTTANRKQAYNWVGTGKKFPAWTYIAIMRELERTGATAPHQLWTFRGI